MSEPLQGMLFGTTSAEPTQTDAQEHELRLCALNVNNPNLRRAARIIDWLLATTSNTLVLSEMHPSEGGRHILSCLEAEGYTTTCTPGWQDSRYFAVVATRGTTTSPVQPPGFDPRIAAVDLTTPNHGVVRVVGIYGPTNGMTTKSSTQRRAFQRQLIDYLTTIRHDAMCVAGDLNVIEPDHRPRLPAYQDHDYAFYTALLDLGLHDAYRLVKPDGGDHSWISPRLGNQRLDHALVSPSVGEVRTCAYDHTTRSLKLSDHAALLATITPR